MNSIQQKAGMVSLVGLPNAGKSTLFNRVMGESLSISSPKPQTTRDQIKGILTDDQKNAQIVFLDTPGIIKTKKDTLSHHLVAEIESAVSGSDLVWFLLDPRLHEVEAGGGLKGDPILALAGLLKKFDGTIFLVQTKCDLETKTAHIRNQVVVNEVLQMLEGKKVRQFAVSAKTGENLDQLMKETWETLPAGSFLFPDSESVTDRPMRFIVSEKIRESVFFLYREEVPYSVAVEVTNYKEQENLTRVEAVLYVEKESQKGILVGKGGEAIKRLGTEARKRIEVILGGKMFLGLQVKVLPNWTKDPVFLQKLGYSS